VAFRIVVELIGDRRMTLSINGKTYEAGELIAYVKKIEKENTELKKKIRCECTRCVYSDSPCIRSDYGVENDEDVCPNYKNVFAAYNQIKEENTELKKMYHESDEDNNKLRENIPILAEAKEIIKTFLAIANNDVEYVQNPQDCKDLWKELCENAKQFIKDNEVKK
jgi:hypothetical protein